MSKTFKAIPTNLITGFLGSGKTTAILQLLKSRPKNSRWAVLVNEFGDVGIDGALFENNQLDDAQSNALESPDISVDNGIFIREVPGGCLCCAAGLPLQMSLNLLIKQAQPERILIEPTGVGHPKRVMETLTGGFYQDVLDVRAAICLVDAKKLQDKTYLENETFIDQIKMADVLLASKSDLATQEELDYFYKFGHSFTRPKDHIDNIEYGRFPVNLLDIERNEQRLVDFSEDQAAGHSIKKQADHGHESLQNMQPNDGCDWKRFENNGHDYYGCGWVFNKAIVFDAQKLEQWANDKTLSRIKGIFHTNNGWLLFNRSEQQLTKQQSSYSDDSRVEIIEPDYHDWIQIEESLLYCIETF